jgi:hypothetical protein
MVWIIDVDLVSFESADHPDAYELYFDVTYPGETWCRSVVRVAGDLAFPSEEAVVSQARDALVGLLEREARPASAAIRLDAAGVTLIALDYPGG